MDGEQRGSHSRLSAVIRDANKTLINADTRTDIESGVCGVLTDSDPYLFAWIGEFNEETREVHPRAMAGGAAGYTDDISIVVDKGQTDNGPTATAIQSGTIQVMQDIRNDPDYEPWREAALERGFESSAAVPIATDGERYGVLNVYAERPEAFDETEQRLLTELCDTVATAVAGASARRELQRERQQYKKLTERFSDAYYAVDDEWRVTYWNDKMADRTGVPAEEIQGQIFWEAFPEILGTENERQYREAMETQRRQSFEAHLDEPYDYWVEVDVYPDEDGLSVFSREITARKEHEQKLSETNRRLRAIIENTSEAIYIKDTEGVYQLINQAGADLLGLGPDEVVGKQDAELFDDDSRVEIEQVDQEIIDTGRPVNEEAVRHIDGEKYVFLDNKFPYRDGDHNVVGIVGVSRDITDRREREEELQKTTGTLEAIIDSSPDPIAMVDGDREVVRWNRAAEDVFGWPAAEVLGKRAPFVPDDKQEEFGTFIDQLDDGETLQTVDTVRQSKEGKRLNVSLSSTRVESNGKLVGYLGTFQDISQRIEYENRIEKQRDGLELLNEMVRHDIRNDLQVIQSHANILGTRIDGEHRDHIEKILANTGSAVALTETARDVSKAMLRTDREPEPISLRATLEPQLDQVRSAHTDAVVVTDSPVPAISVLADEMLSSVVRNLLNNAILHNDKEIPQVAVSVEERGDRVVVSVADNGPGVPDEQKTEIFGHGEQGLESDGSGIGLYLVDTLVEHYGGRVWVSDHPDSDAASTHAIDGDTGAVFCVELKCAREGTHRRKK